MYLSGNNIAAGIMSLTQPTAPTPWRRFLMWASRVGLAKQLALALSLAAILAGFATYAALTEAPPFGATNPATTTFLLTLDLVLLLLLGVLIARRFVQIMIDRKSVV